MRRTWWVAGLVGGLLAANAGRADDLSPPVVERLDITVLQVPEVVKKDDPKAKDPPKKDVPKAKEPPKKEAEPDAFARASDMSGEAPAGSFSRMMGDLMGGAYATQIIQVPAYQVTTKTLFTTQIVTKSIKNSQGELITAIITIPVPSGTKTDFKQTVVTTQAQVPILGRGAFKIAENERPTPEDRFILSFNAYTGLPGSLGGPSPNLPPMGDGSALPTSTVTRTIIPQAPVLSPIAAAPNVAVAVSQTTLNGSPASVRTILPNPSSTVYREVIGFEKSIFDGQVSVGVRAPFFQQATGDGSVGANDFGDLTFVFKYLAYQDSQLAGSIGLAVTAPTGPAIPTVVGDIHGSLLQPFVGGVASFGDVFGIAFSSVAIPVNNKDTTILFNDLGVGMTIYQGGPGSFLTWLAPVTEVHVTTPLNNRLNALVTVPDLVTITQGLQMGFGAAGLNLGVAIPVTGPRPFDLEMQVQFNLRF
ncbi:MAG TPA: hypothetical protein VHR66_26610 [Gemmataceae bacterium]|jgi:hypothetical protein|nr:hypothetical protein [Gemmataceae bacterium]